MFSLHCYHKNYQLLFDCHAFLTADNSQRHVVARGESERSRKLPCFSAWRKKHEMSDLELHVVLFYPTGIPGLHPDLCHIPGLLVKIES